MTILSGGVETNTASIATGLAAIFLSIFPTIAFGQLTITHQGTINTSGLVEGVRTGVVVGNFPEFNTALGRLINSSVSLNANILNNITVPAVPSFGPVLNQFISIKLNTSGYGITPLESSAGSGLTCPGQSGCRGTTLNYQFGSLSASGNITGMSGLGGPISYRVESTITPFQSGGTGNFNLTGAVSTSQTYAPKTKAEYMADAVVNLSGSDVSRANQGYGSVIELRNFDPVTASQNTALRDAEYKLRGYAGGGSNRNGEPLDTSSGGAVFQDVANRSGPIGTAVYNGIKVFNDSIGRNTAGSDQLPNSRPGGFDANFEGFRDGLLGTPLNDSIGSPKIEPPASAPSKDKDMPSQPTIRLSGLSSQVDLFNVLPQSNSISYFDPKEGNLIIFGVTGNRFTGVELPFDIFTNNAKIHVGNSIFSLSSNEFIDFNAIDPLGFNGFFISGLADFSPAGRELEFGLRFISSDNAIVAIASADGQRLSAVPEPPTLLLFVLGLCFILSRRIFPNRNYLQ